MSTQVQTWHPLIGTPSALHGTCAMALAAEVFVEHDHFDAEPCYDWSAGKIINRHLRDDLHIADHEPVTYDTPGIDEDPSGCAVSLASGSVDGKPSRIQSILESLDYDCSGMSRHQLDWTFLAHHVELAYRRYHAHDASTRSVTENMRLELSEFEKAEALAIYANSFGIRGIMGPSGHACDVLLSTSNCGGISMTLLMLAQVAGIEARMINTINHSTVELKVGGRWLWSDNIVGSRALILASYQEMLADPHDIVCMTPLELKYHTDLVPHYRAPYNFSTTRRWKGPGWKPESATDDTNNGIGYSLAYTPETAAALYPGREQVFHVPKSEKPMLALNKLGGWIYASVDGSQGISMRKVFHIGECADNPVRSACIRVFVNTDANEDDYTATLNGSPLKCEGKRSCYEHMHAIYFAINPTALQIGLNECIISTAANSSAQLLVYPDVLENSPAPVLDQKIELTHDSFSCNEISQSQQF